MERLVHAPLGPYICLCFQAVCSYCLCALIKLQSRNLISRFNLRYLYFLLGSCSFREWCGDNAMECFVHASVGHQIPAWICFGFQHSLHICPQSHDEQSDTEQSMCVHTCANIMCSLDYCFKSSVRRH